MKSELLGMALLLAPTVAWGERLSVLDNGTIRVGVDLDRGGSITLLATAPGGANVINSHDLGRQVQQSYYSGPQPFGTHHPGWKDWPWNPIGSGDVYGNPSRIVTHSNDGQTLHVETIPMQWALDKVPGECTFDTWIRLDGKAARVRSRLSNRRSDLTQYPARDQELPAVYTVGTLSRLVTYDGPRPFTGAPVSRIENQGPPWRSWKATENWAALLDDSGRGLGVIHPGVYSFLGGFHGKPGTGGPRDDSTGYIAPVRPEILDAAIVYEYEYVLVLGTLDEIRAEAVARRVPDTRPDDRFTTDRRHWTYRNATDGGLPCAGALRLKVDRDDPQLIGPERWWAASDVPKLYLKAAFRTRQARAELYWSTFGEIGFSTSRRLAFDVIPDGEFYTYTIDLAASPHYRGTITGLRFDPVAEGEPGGEVRVASLSWQPEQDGRESPIVPGGPGSRLETLTTIECSNNLRWMSWTGGVGWVVTQRSDSIPGWVATQPTTRRNLDPPIAV